MSPVCIEILGCIPQRHGHYCDNPSHFHPIAHNWVGGAIGAVGLAAGIAAGALVAGSLGWIIGGAITALFGSKLLSADDALGSRLIAAI